MFSINKEGVFIAAGLEPQSQFHRVEPSSLCNSQGWGTQLLNEPTTWTEWASGISSANSTGDQLL